MGLEADRGGQDFSLEIPLGFVKVLVPVTKVCWVLHYLWFWFGGLGGVLAFLGFIWSAFVRDRPAHVGVNEATEHVPSPAGGRQGGPPDGGRPCSTCGHAPNTQTRTQLPRRWSALTRQWVEIVLPPPETRNAKAWYSIVDEAVVPLGI